MFSQAMTIKRYISEAPPCKVHEQIVIVNRQLSFNVRNAEHALARPSSLLRDRRVHLVHFASVQCAALLFRHSGASGDICIGIEIRRCCL